MKKTALIILFFISIIFLFFSHKFYYKKMDNICIKYIEYYSKEIDLKTLDDYTKKIISRNMYKVEKNIKNYTWLGEFNALLTSFHNNCESNIAVIKESVKNYNSKLIHEFKIDFKSEDLNYNILFMFLIILGILTINIFLYYLFLYLVNKKYLK